MLFVSVFQVLTTFVPPAARVGSAFGSVTPQRFGRFVHLHIELVDETWTQPIRPVLRQRVSVRFLLDLRRCLAVPGVTKGHLGKLDVHFQRVIRWPVPPVGNRLLIGCRDVGKVLDIAVIVAVFRRVRW